jgi:hypothetical protein
MSVGSSQSELMVNQLFNEYFGTDINYTNVDRKRSLRKRSFGSWIETFQTKAMQTLIIDEENEGRVFKGIITSEDVDSDKEIQNIDDFAANIDKMMNSERGVMVSVIHTDMLPGKVDHMEKTTLGWIADNYPHKAEKLKINDNNRDTKCIFFEAHIFDDYPEMDDFIWDMIQQEKLDAVSLRGVGIPSAIKCSLDGQCGTEVKNTRIWALTLAPSGEQAADRAIILEKVKDTEFEGKHPRADDGKFGSKPSDNDSDKPSSKKKEEIDEVNWEEEANKLKNMNRREVMSTISEMEIDKLGNLTISISNAKTYRDFSSTMWRSIIRRFKNEQKKLPSIVLFNIVKNERSLIQSDNLWYFKENMSKNDYGKLKRLAQSGHIDVTELHNPRKPKDQSKMSKEEIAVLKEIRNEVNKKMQLQKEIPSDQEKMMTNDEPESTMGILKEIRESVIQIGDNVTEDNSELEGEDVMNDPLEEGEMEYDDFAAEGDEHEDDAKMDDESETGDLDSESSMDEDSEYSEDESEETDDDYEDSDMEKDDDMEDEYEEDESYEDDEDSDDDINIDIDIDDEEEEEDMKKMTDKKPKDPLVRIRSSELRALEDRATNAEAQLIKMKPVAEKPDIEAMIKAKVAEELKTLGVRKTKTPEIGADGTDKGDANAGAETPAAVKKPAGPTFGEVSNHFLTKMKRPPTRQELHDHMVMEKTLPGA